jgi:cephalosporin hydroxylase
MIMNATETYLHNRDEQIKENMENRDLQMMTSRYTEELVKSNYVKNFTWRGVPVLQYPQDIMVMQEIIWKVKPDYIIEIGVAFGGMTVFYANLLNLIGHGHVIAVDIDIRPHAIDVFRHFKIKYSDDIPFGTDAIVPVEESSISENALRKVREAINTFGRGKILVSLDSNHTHNHVLQELRLYAPLVSVGSYIVVFDTSVEFFGHLDKNQDRPWGKGNNPWTAVQEFLKETDDFVVDKEIEQRALITSAIGGFLRRIK